MNEFNRAEPLIMHVDLNSCFATIEQQSRPLLRGKPVVVTNRLYDNAVVVTASYEAKALGIKTGMRLRQAKLLSSQVVAVETDPPKYRYIYRRLLEIMSDYSASVAMKSIDEGVIDFAAATEAVRRRGLVAIGQEIKQRLRDEVGVWMRCNIGIGVNRFYAKTAAGLNKPDGLDVLTSHNIMEIFSRLKLQDLTGIAGGNQRRLNAVGIFTPLDFLSADLMILQVAFKQVVGDKWHRRLRGWEVDDIAPGVKSCGRQYVLQDRSITKQQIEQLLHNLVEDVGAKLRGQGKVARGVKVYIRRFPTGFWQNHYLAALPFMSDQAIWQIVRQLFVGAPEGISMINVSCYDLSDDTDGQLSLFGDELARHRRVADVTDSVNQRYGARTLHSASTLQTDKLVRPKVPFGSTRYL